MVDKEPKNSYNRRYKGVDVYSADFSGKDYECLQNQRCREKPRFARVKFYPITRTFAQLPMWELRFLIKLRYVGDIIEHVWVADPNRERQFFFSSASKFDMIGVTFSSQNPSYRVRKISGGEPQ